MFGQTSNLYFAGPANSPIVEFAVDSLKALQKQEARAQRNQALKARQGQLFTSVITSLSRVMHAPRQF